MVVVVWRWWRWYAHVMKSLKVSWVNSWTSEAAAAAARPSSPNEYLMMDGTQSVLKGEEETEEGRKRVSKKEKW